MYARKRRGKRIVRKPVPQRKPADFWSEYQNKIFNHVSEGDGHSVVLAAPGAGKSTTIVESLHHVPKDEESLCLAFNKSIALELTLRIPLGSQVRTFHRLGLETVKENWGSVYGLSGREFIDKDDEGAMLLAAKAVGSSENSLKIRENIVWAIKMAKTMLADTPQEIESVCRAFGISSKGIDDADFCLHVHNILQKMKVEPVVVNGIRTISFDDMLWLPHVHGWSPKKYDRVFVDEAQDLSASRISLVSKALKPGGRLCAVGDRHQCVHEDTLISTPNGKVKVTNIKAGDKVLSWRNNCIIEQTVKHNIISKWNHGIEITTKSGKTLAMSPDHKIWASDFKLKGDQHIVYLMYRSDMGYRIGITNKYKDTSKLGQRAVSEGADKLWIIKICESKKDALLEEQTISLEYQIPMYVFNAIGRANTGVSQNRSNAIFEKFGQNGVRLLDDYNMHQDLPHWSAYSCTTARRPRFVIKVVAHGSKGTTVIAEWSENSMQVRDILESNGVVVTKAKKDNRFRVRKYTSNYRDALVYAEMIRGLIPGSYISEKLHTSDACINLITASGIHVGASVAVQDGEKVVLEEVISIKEINGSFYDLDVDDASNFFGGDILSHNCIYGFAGADSKVIDTMINDMGAIELPLSVSYRCPRKVVELASDINPDIKASPQAIEGEVGQLEANLLSSSIKENSAILSRNNFQLVSTAFALLKDGVKASIIGKDIGNRFNWRINNWRPTSVQELKRSIAEWSAEMCANQTNTSNLLRINDEAASINKFTDGADTVEQVQERIKLFFSESEKDQVKLSTCHKAKGLEWDNVYMLEKTFKPGKNQEEDNIQYVAITRAKKSLTFVR